MPILGKEILFLISIVVFSAFAPQVHAEENSKPIILEINKEEYHLGEQITIMGIMKKPSLYQFRKELLTVYSLDQL